MADHFTEDAFLGGQLTVFQPSKGFRAGTDSVLLAAAMAADARGSALELGCGAGGALLPLAVRAPQLNLTGLERDPEMIALAEMGVRHNQLSARVDCIAGDVGQLPSDWQNKFDYVFSNPPFFEAGKIQDPAPEKQHAYIESLSLKAWLDAMLFSTRQKGTLLLIHRAAELAKIMALLERRTGEITIMPIRSFPGSDATRVIVRARKGLRSGPARLLSGLTLYQCRGGRPTPEIEAISRGGDGLNWSGA